MTRASRNNVLQILGLTLGVVLGALAVDKVEPLGLEQLVGLGAGQRGNGLAREAVADLLALLALLLLLEIHDLKGHGAADQLVRELGLVLLCVVVVVDVVASAPGVVYALGQHTQGTQEIVVFLIPDVPKSRKPISPRSSTQS